MIDYNRADVRSQLMYDANRKSVLVAYLLFFFLGGLGIHRFYLGRTGSGIVQLILSVTGWGTVAFLIGFVPLGVLAIWLLIDLFTIPGMVRDGNTRLADAVTRY